MSLDIYLAAIDTLASEGKKPTLRAIRAHVGKGSFSSIQCAIEIYEARQNRPASHEPVGPLPSELSTLAEEMWQRASEIAQARLEAERTSLRATRNELDERRADMFATADDLADQVDVLSASLDEERRLRAVCETELQELKIKLAVSEDLFAKKLKKLLADAGKPASQPS